MTSDQIGRLAEAAAYITLSRPVGGRWRRPLFRAATLGEKYPAVDLLVDVIDADDRSLGYFFAQVKGTESLASLHGRLPVTVPRSSFNALVRMPARRT